MEMRVISRAVFLPLVVVCSAWAAFGRWGIVLAAGLLFVALYVLVGQHMSKSAKAVWWIVFCLYLFNCLIWTVKDVIYVKEHAPRASCAANLRDIMFALKEYDSKNGSLPPAFIAAANGKPMHSWRTLLLPYLDEQALHAQYNMSEAWNGPNNSKLAVSLREFVCPSHPGKPGATSYLAVVGPNTGWPDKKPLKLSELPDDGRNTIMLVEIADSDIPWTEPRDLTIEEAIGAIQSGPHGGDATNVAFADGRIRCLPAYIPRDALERFLKTSGQDETPGIETLLSSLGPGPSPPVPWNFIVPALVTVLSYVVLVSSPRRRVENDRQEA